MQVDKEIKIYVCPEFCEKQTQTLNCGQFAFSYFIGIENNSNHKIKLISRFWDINVSPNVNRNVEGIGVVGKQPELGPGESFLYNSFCVLDHTSGSMKGHFHFLNLNTKDMFTVKIPKFDLALPWLMN